LKELEQNPNKKFLDAIEQHWLVDPPGVVDGDDVFGVVDGTSVCWLFCWAKAEQAQNEAAAEHAKYAFDMILDVPLWEFDRAVSHAWAQDEGRYGNRALVDAELSRLLGGAGDARNADSD
jgi:hypothetical protein